MAARARRRAAGALAVFVLLICVGSATAGTRPADRLAQAVATVAGRQVAVSCEGNHVLWKQEIAAADMAAQAVAYYDPNADLVRFGPLICKDISRSRRGASLATVRALFVAAHEAAHATGIEDEGIANCWGLYWAQDLARRFYGVEFFTPDSRRVRAYARQIQRDSPLEYRSACPV